MDPPADKKYWAFISYSSLDRKWGQWLHRRLENYPIPKEFRGTEIFDGAVLGKNLRPIFRDRDELPGSAELGPAILKGLKQSRFLIVLCSPNSAQSRWVNKEIVDFIALHGDRNILALILSGNPNASSPGNKLDPTLECLPPALRHPAEPLAGDLRKEGDGKERGFLKILAGISQLDFDALYRRHERAQRTRRIVWGTTAALIITALAGLSAFSIQKTREQRVLLNNVALADHDSALQAFDLGQYRESAAYYARSLSIRPNNNTIALSAVSSTILADTLFAKQRFIRKFDQSLSSLSLHASGTRLLVKTDSAIHVLSLLDGRSIGPLPSAEFTQLTPPPLASILAQHPWLSEQVPDLSSAALSPDGTTLFAADSSGRIHRFDPDTRTDQWSALPKQRKNNITHLALSTCGQTIAVADWDSSLSLVDAHTGRLLDSVIFAHNVEHLDYTPDGFFLLAASKNGHLRVFNTGASPVLTKTTRPPHPEAPPESPIQFHFEDGRLYIDDLGDGTAFKDPFLLPVPPHILRIAPNHRYLIAGTNDGQLTNSSLLSGSATTTRGGKITDIAISRDSATYFVASQDCSLVAYDTTTTAERWRQNFKGFVNQISLSQNDIFIAAASDDFTFRIFDAATGKTVWSTLTDNCVETITFLPDQPHLLRCTTRDHLFTLDCSHLFKTLTDERGTLSSHLVENAATRVHELVPTITRRHRAAPDHIQTILAWRLSHPARQTRSPFSPVPIATHVSEGLPLADLADADQFHQLAPWHPLTPVSLARLPRNADNHTRQRFLCELSLARFISADPELWNADRLAQDRSVAAQWMNQLGHPDLAARILAPAPPR
ncbi:MAG: toll/interleukin-1 receptor domain-containing protein [Verrucomicrobia bacterium]|nr:toll/interleukin-1 receptor domain-containing protein [Verrucomicrobiota bacterium]